MIVTIQHMHTVPTWTGRQGYCHGQGRAFAERNGLDWMSFVQHGIDADKLLATGDAMAAALVDHARNEVAHGR